MKNIPERIYLQIDADGETPDDFKGLQVTWSSERVFDNDLVYVLEKKKQRWNGRFMMLNPDDTFLDDKNIDNETK